MNIKIRSSRGDYEVTEFNSSKFFLKRQDNNFFYIIDKNVYKKK